MTNALSNPTAQAFLLLRIAFTVAPILFGLDKFVGERLARRRGARRDWRPVLTLRFAGGAFSYRAQPVPAIVNADDLRIGMDAKHPR